MSFQAGRRRSGAAPLAAMPGLGSRGHCKVQALVAQVDPLIEVDPHVEDLIVETADDFITSVVITASA